jgi:hypothetical protein
MRHLGKVSIAVVLLVSACSMYGEKAPKLRNPVPVKPDLSKTSEPPVAQTPDNEVCEFYERDMPVPKRTAKTAELEQTGDARTQVFTKASDVNAKQDALIDAIDAYGRALASDPFNPDLTLKLALSYDKAYRKGCALALLKRLQRLSNNEKFAKKANPVINEVLDRKDYFQRYRKDAIDAVGR